MIKKRAQTNKKADDVSIILDAKQKSLLDMTGGSENHFVSFLNTHDSDKIEKEFRDRM